MKKLPIFLVSTFFTLTVLAQSPAFEWAGRLGADSTDFGITITTDVSGNVYNAGSCTGIVDFDPTAGTYTLAPAAGNMYELDAYITKSDPAGNLIWAKRIGDSATFMRSNIYRNGASSIKTDAVGNVYVLGYYKGTVDFDPGPGTYTLVSASSNSFYWQTYILKLDASGNFQWVKEFADVYFGLPLEMEMDASANLYITGYYKGTIDLDPGPATFSYSSTNAESYLVKLDAGGNFIFGKRFESYNNTGDVYSCSLKRDPLGNIYVTGFFFGTIDFDPGPATSSLTSTYLSYNFVLKLDPVGNLLWVKNFGGIESRSLVLDDTGIYLTGTLQDTTDMDPGPGVYSLMATGDNGVQLAYYDQFVLKLDLNGNFVWAKCISSVGTSYGLDIAMDAASNIYASGYFEVGADFDPGSSVSYLANNGGIDGFIQKLDASGNFIWARTLGGNANDYITAITMSHSSDILGTGFLESTSDADPTSSTFNLYNAGVRDAFVFKWSQCSAANTPTDSTLPQNKMICANTSASLSAFANNPIAWFGTSNGTISLGTGSFYLTPPLTVGTYTYYAAELQCSGFSRTAITLSVEACTGLNEINHASTNIMEIYPIPSPDGYFTIHMTDYTENMSVKVYTTLGELILDQRILSEKTSMEVDRPAGIYFVHLMKADKSLEVRKIIKR